MTEQVITKIRKPILHIGVPTVNSRTYNNDVAKRMVSGQKQVPVYFYIEECYGNTNIPIESIAGAVTKLEIENEMVMADIDVFDTHYGNILFNIKNSVELNTIGEGSVAAEGLVEPDYLLTGVSFIQ